MRLLLKPSFYMLLGALFLTPNVVPAHEELNVFAPNVTANRAALKNDELNIIFPDVDGWGKDSIVRYPRPELGYSVSYESEEGGKVTVYVYNGGRGSIPSDTSNSILKSEIDKAKNEIYKVAEAGYYQNVKEVLSDTPTLGGETGKIKALHSLFNFSMRGQDLSSDIYLFGYRNHFIKIRATRPKDAAGIENKSLADLLAAFDALFSAELTARLVRVD